MTKNLPHRAEPDSDLALPSPLPPPLPSTESTTLDSNTPLPDSDPALCPQSPQKSATSQPHAPLISLLTTFYTLLSDLRYHKAEQIAHPPHPSDSINLEEAAEYNFTDPDALALLYQLPYLVISGERELWFNTPNQCYLGKHANWETARDPTYGGEDLIPRHMVNLTSPYNSGVNILYDVRACTITAWNHFEDGPFEDNNEPEHDFARSLRARVPRGMGDPENQLVQWVLRLLKLDHAPRITRNNWNVIDTTRFEDGKALKKVYKEAGWDPSAAEGLEAAAWVAQALGEDPDGTILVAKLEEARIKAKRNFDVEMYARLHKEWEREYEDYDHYEEYTRRTKERKEREREEMEREGRERFEYFMEHGHDKGESGDDTGDEREDGGTVDL